VVVCISFLAGSLSILWGGNWGVGFGFFGGVMRIGEEGVGGR